VQLLRLAAALIVAAGSYHATANSRVDERAGSLIARDGTPCPLKNTAVKAEISGPLARVRVTQTFTNASREKIEAVYVFPLPPGAAVDEMTMLVGDRVIKGTIKRREEALAIYEAARASGRIAGLLDQERPNLFTQAVANILPGATVKIAIGYVETLPYEAGVYEFVFPMVVGPRYLPRALTDADRISPPVTPDGTRAGHDISIDVALDAGMPVQAVQSSTHEIAVERPSTQRATVRLARRAVIPNKDFVLHYDAAGPKIGDAVLAHSGPRGGFLTLVLTPPDQRPAIAEIAPKELVFVLDTSGSMHGFPIEKAKETMRLALDALHPRDTFNLITFSGDTEILFPAPVAATPENLERARRFLESRTGRGGTEMMKAIRAALEPGSSREHIRVVCFMTDGYVGNEFEILSEIQRHPDARVFAFGIGSSPNRYLLDNMALIGRGEVEYVSLNGDGSAAARRFHERVRTPLLTDISIDWSGLPVTDTHPARISDLFSAKPVVVSARYSAPAKGVIRLRGKVAGREIVREIPVTLPATEPRHEALAALWARRRIGDLMAQDLLGAQRNTFRADLREEVTQLALDFRLMSQFTSLVAVEEMVVTEGGQPRRVEVPVEMPEGVSYEGIFGDVALAGAAVKVAPMAAFTPGIAPRRTMLRLEARPAPEALEARAKIDPALLAVRTGKIRIQIALAEATPANLAALKKLGFELLAHPHGGRLVIGRVDAAKLDALVRLTFVRYVGKAPL
jgi:Ca-activated chloride channel family protein